MSKTISKKPKMTAEQRRDFWQRFWFWSVLRPQEGQPALSLGEIDERLDDIEQELLGFDDDDSTPIDLNTADVSGDLYDWLNQWGVEQVATFSDRVGNVEEDRQRLADLIEQLGAEFVPQRPRRRP